MSSLNIGRPQSLVHRGQTFRSAINRTPVRAAVVLGRDGFEGDCVSNVRVHGGPDKAACVYPHEHYAHWQQRLGRPMGVPSFGENLTTLGLLEAQVCVGDVYAIGAARVQVSQPRQPCANLIRKHDEPRLPAWINEQGFTGFYFRMLEPGNVAPGDGIALLERPRADWPVTRLCQARLNEQLDMATASALAALPELSTSWRAHFVEIARRASVS